jgi:glycosyltransferase involved in cell wall biosynthesis
MRLLVCADWTDWEQEALDNAAEALPVPIDVIRQRWRPARRVARYLAGLAEAARILRAMSRYDTVIVWQQVVGVMVAVAAPETLLRRCPIVITGFIWSNSGSGPLRAVRRHAVSRAVRRAAAVICYSSHEARVLGLLCPLAVDRIHFVRLGFDVPEAKAAPSASEGPIVVAAGTSNRDYRTLLSAATLTTLTIRVYAPEDALPADPNRPGNVILAGGFTWDGFFRDLSTAGAVVIALNDPKKTSGQLVAIQAMQYGRPIVATRSDALDDYLLDGQTAMLVPPHDADALADALVTVISNLPLARRLGANARQYAQANLSSKVFWEKMISITLAAQPRRERFPADARQEADSGG